MSWLRERVYHFDRAPIQAMLIQTMMYLKLCVAGHLSIFLNCTRGPFWSIRPAKTLLVAAFGGKKGPK